MTIIKNQAAVELGRKGGQAKTEKKRQALVENLKKAREAKQQKKVINTPSLDV